MFALKQTETERDPENRGEKKEERLDKNHNPFFIMGKFSLEIKQDLLSFTRKISRPNKVDPWQFSTNFYNFAKASSL